MHVFVAVRGLLGCIMKFYECIVLNVLVCLL